MKTHSRLLSGLLALLLVFGLILPGMPASAQPDEPEAPNPPAVTGSLTMALRLDYAQPLEALTDHQVKAALYQGDEMLGEVPLSATARTPQAGPNIWS